MPAWQRAEAYFGTNGIQLVKADFNATTARLEAVSLGHLDINPCFQALLCARLLLPNVQVFEVYVKGAPRPALTVDSEALDQTLPIWNQALTTFDSMPFSAFLPANLVARSSSESETTAVRGVSWIAADDLLDAIDGGPPALNSAALAVLRERVALVVLALTQCAALVPVEACARLTAIRSAADELQAELLRLPPPPLSSNRLDALTCTGRIRDSWSAWGPMPRLPGIPEDPAGQYEMNRQPAIKTKDDNAAWRTL
jgi:hypothetical protein